MPNGGALAICAPNVHVGDGGDLAAGDYVAIATRDNSGGMTQAVIKRAVDPFFTAKPIGQGTSLGLSIAFGHAKQPKGHLRVESEEGRGATITPFLPRAGGAGRAARAGRAHGASASC